jgi:TetR/AcrR family transcriptional regulator, cholesterol catabolism regulator
MTEVNVDSPTKRPPWRRRAEVLDAAARVFHEKGYESTTIQEIAEAVGILKGSLYYYVQSKEDLLYEILESVHAEALLNVERIESMEGDALQKTRAFVTSHILFNAENLMKMGVFLHDFRSLSPERRRTIVEERDSYDGFLRRLLHQGQEEGTVCPDLDPKLVSLAALGMMNWIYQWYQPSGSRAASDIAGEFADLLIAGVACDPASHRPGHRRELAGFGLAAQIVSADGEHASQAGDAVAVRAQPLAD